MVRFAQGPLKDILSSWDTGLWGWGAVDLLVYFYACMD